MNINKPHREVKRPDGVREIQEWTGPASLQHSDRASNWRTVAELREGEVLGGFVKVATDIELSEHPKGQQAGLLRVGGTTHALTLQQLEDLGQGIAELVSELKAVKDDPTPAKG